jgi:1,4-dihydroxy-2-naphthoate octaprenyltransferase
MHTKQQNSPVSMFIWLQTIRPKTLTAAFIPFSAGAALAYAGGASIAWGLLLSALASALCIQIASNLLNDAFDFVKDTSDPERLGPKRAIHLGLANGQDMYRIGLFFFLLTLLFGIPLIVHGGVSIVVILGLSILAAYLYSGGPLPLTSVGLGDLFVLIFYGWVATLAGYWLQTGYLDAKGLLLGTQIGLLCTSIIAIDNYRDIESDSKAGKKTLAVRFGRQFGKMEIAALTSIPFALNLLWLTWGYHYAAFLPFLTAPLGAFIVYKTWNSPPSSAFNIFLGLAALLHLSFGLLLIIGFILQ